RLVNTATGTPPAGETDNNLNNNTATDTDTITQVADLAITKTDGVSSVVAGTSTTYTIVVTNNGPSTSLGASVFDATPAQVTGDAWTFVGGSGGGAITSGSPSTGTRDLSTKLDPPWGAIGTF